MAQEIINVGSSPDAGDGDTLRSALIKTNNNFTELYGKVGDFPDGLGVTGQTLVIQGDGTVSWASPGSIGTDAATLNGEAPSYYLDYGNFTNTPTIPSTLSALNDVAATSPTSGQVLSFDGAVWSPSTPTAVPQALNDLTNVSVPTPSNGQALVWNGGAWVAGAVAADIGSTSVDALSDVDTTSSAPTNGQALVWDGSNWVPGTVASTDISSASIDDLSDVNTAGAISGSVLKYNGATWVVGVDDNSGSGGIALTDLSVSTAAAGSAALTYNNTSGVFTFTPPDLTSYATTASLATVATSGAYSDLTGTPTLATVATSGAYSDLTGTPTVPTNVADLADVSAVSPSTGQVLKWDGAAWAPASDLTSSGTGIALTDLSVNVAAAGSANLTYNNTSGVFTYTPPDLSSYLTSISALSVDALSDVDTTSNAPTNGQALTWNGTNWVPGAVAADISSTSIDALADVDTTSSAPTNGQALVWDGSNFVPGSVAGDISTSSINALADVDTVTAAPTNGQALVWDGSNFVPGDVASVDGVINFDVTASGTDHYVFNGGGTNNVNDPILYLTRGQTYTFSMNTTGSPLFIKTVQSTGSADSYNTGVVGNGSDVGTITFTVPMDAPDTLYYNSQYFPNMYGTIYILDHYTQADWNVSFATKTTDDLSEGVINQWYTDERVDDRVNTLISAGAGINLNYDDVANTLTIEATGGGTGGSTTFLGLTDTPSSFAGFSNKFLSVNAAGDAVEFADISTALWGSDVKGSVFGDDSTILVDGVSNLITGDVLNTSVRTDSLGTASSAVLSVANNTQLTFGAGGYILGAPTSTLGTTRIEGTGISFYSTLPMLVRPDPLSPSQNLEFQGLFTGSLNGAVNGTLSGDVTSTNTSTFNNLVVNGSFTSTGQLEGNFLGNFIVGGLNSYVVKTDQDDVIINEFGEVQNLNGQSPSYFLDFGNFTNTPVIPSVTDEISEAQGATNKYFTDARARASLSAGTGVTYNNVSGEISIGQDIATNATPTFAELTVTGNLTVQGTTTTLDTQQLLVEDNIITLNSNVTTGVPSLNAGIEVSRGDSATVQFVWDEAADEWSFGNESVKASTFVGTLDGSISSTTATIELTSATNKIRSYYATLADLPAASTYNGMFAVVQGEGEAYAAVGGSWSKLIREGGGITTDDVAEGNNNLYWTEARGDTNFTDNLLAISTDNLAEGNSNRYYQTTYFNQDFDYRLSNLLSSDIEEGTTNLYWTEDRFDNSLSLKTSDDLAEGIANYYFTAARFNTEFGNKGIDDLSDVQLGAPAVGDVLQWNGTEWTNGAEFTSLAGDLKGSVFADDSSVMVDGLTGEIKGRIANDELSIQKQGNALYFTPTEASDGYWFTVGNTAEFYIDGTVNIAGTVALQSNVETKSGVNFVPEFDLDGDIGSASKRYNTMYVETISASNVISDLKGSVFAQDSTQIINDIDGTVVGDVINANTTTNVLKTGKLSRGWTELITNVTAEAGSAYIVDTSVTGGVTITLPATAELGDEIRVIDGFGTASQFNITIARNGHNIQGRADDLVIQTDRSAFGLVYYNAEQGWILTEN
jgi:hypothetical protein